jgi:hypothetical protein
MTPFHSCQIRIAVGAKALVVGQTRLAVRPFRHALLHIGAVVVLCAIILITRTGRGADRAIFFGKRTVTGISFRTGSKHAANVVSAIAVAARVCAVTIIGTVLLTTATVLSTAIIVAFPVTADSHTDTVL